MKLEVNSDLEIARNIGRMKAIPKYKRDKILEKGENELSSIQINKINMLKIDMEYSKKTYEIAELNYSKGPPIGENLFITGITDYILRTKMQL